MISMDWKANGSVEVYLWHTSRNLQLTQHGFVLWSAQSKAYMLGFVTRRSLPYQFAPEE